MGEWRGEGVEGWECRGVGERAVGGSDRSRYGWIPSGIFRGARYPGWGEGKESSRGRGGGERVYSRGAGHPG